jgi:hypothetical protein
LEINIDGLPLAEAINDTKFNSWSVAINKSSNLKYHLVVISYNISYAQLGICVISFTGKIDSYDAFVVPSVCESKSHIV